MFGRLCEQLIAYHLGLRSGEGLEARGGVQLPSLDLLLKAAKGFFKGIRGREDLEILARDLDARGGVQLPSFDLLLKAGAVSGRDEVESRLNSE